MTKAGPGPAFFLDSVYNVPMDKAFRIILLLAVIISPALLAETQEQVSTGKTESAQQDMLDTAMDLPDSSAVQSSQASTESTLVTQSGNTMMTSGTCVVVDAFLREFCNANPADISCQF